MEIYILIYFCAGDPYERVVDVFGSLEGAYQHAHDQLQFHIDDEIESCGKCTFTVEDVEDVDDVEIIVRLMSKDGNELEGFFIVKKTLKD